MEEFDDKEETFDEYKERCIKYVEVEKYLESQLAVHVSRLSSDNSALIS